MVRVRVRFRANSRLVAHISVALKICDSFLVTAFLGHVLDPLCLCPGGLRMCLGCVLDVIWMSSGRFLEVQRKAYECAVDVFCVYFDGLRICSGHHADSLEVWLRARKLGLRVFYKKCHQGISFAFFN